ncbi:MAG: hypothetical protein ABSC38_07860 [Verrucomicrobiia bacterium]
MVEYNDPEKMYNLEYPEGWLRLTHEGLPHISLASLTTGGYLEIQAYHFPSPKTPLSPPEHTLAAFLKYEQRTWPDIGEPPIHREFCNGAAMAYAQFTRAEEAAPKRATDFGHARAWVFCRGNIQVRCVYRCRKEDATTDDADLAAIIDSLVLNDTPRISAAGFAHYYFSLLKRHRPRVVANPPDSLMLTLSDGQTVLLEHLYNHYLQQPERLDELIEKHIDLLDYCGDDVPDLTNYSLIRGQIYPKIVCAPNVHLPPHRLPCWPGLAIGAIIQGSVFTYGVGSERLRTWGFPTLEDVIEDALSNLQRLPAIPPRGLCDNSGRVRAISYGDHPLSSSFILFSDFYRTTAQNLGVKEFLVGLPCPGCVSCFSSEDPQFVVQHTAALRWEYHRGIERLTDTIYVVGGPTLQDVQPYDVLHCCPRKV